MKELYVQSDTEIAYQNFYIDETNPVNIVKQKIRMILLTNKGDVLGDPLFGVGLESYIFELEDVKDQLIEEINEQIEKYIGEDSQEYDIKKFNPKLVAKRLEQNSLLEKLKNVNK